MGTSYSVSESSGAVEIAVRAFPDGSGNVPNIGVPFGLRITSEDGSAVGERTLVSDLVLMCLQSQLYTVHKFSIVCVTYPYCVLAHQLLPSGAPFFSVFLEFCTLSVYDFCKLWMDL